MGTRADFYVGRGKQAEWLGSIAWDGYPDGITPSGDELMPPSVPGAGQEYKRIDWPAGAHLFDATTELEFRARVVRFFLHREDVTLPEQGWPWPWEDSSTTDYAYAFDGGKVWASCFGTEWFDATKPQPEDERRWKVAVFPNMKDRQNVTMGKRSGVIVVGSGGIVEGD